MSKTTKKDFNTFKKSVHFWCDKFKVAGWHLYFDHEELGCYASVYADYNTRGVSFKLSTEWEDSKPLNDKEIHAVAKHEVIHLLLWPLYALAGARFVTEAELNAMNEEITKRLDELL